MCSELDNIRRYIVMASHQSSKSLRKQKRESSLFPELLKENMKDAISDLSLEIQEERRRKTILHRRGRNRSFREKNL